MKANQPRARLPVRPCSLCGQDSCGRFLVKDPKDNLELDLCQVHMEELYLSGNILGQLM